MHHSATIRPRLSIGLPVYNGARFLPAALDSLLGQTFGDFELIVSDNASTDETEAIVRDYAQRDARIVYVRQLRNQGAARNFNYVVERAAGECFKWAAADDVCAPTLLQRCIDVLQQDAGVVCCHARTLKIDEEGKPLAQLDDPTDGGLPTKWFLQASCRRHRPDGSSPSPARRFADVLLFSGWGVRSFGVMRTSILRQTSLIKPYYGSEKVMMAELALRGRCYDVPETLFFQRVHEQASSCLSSAGKQSYANGAGGKWAMPRCRQLADFLRAVSQADLSLAERARCWSWLVRYLFQLRKWPALLASAMPGSIARSSLPSRAVAAPPPSMATHCDS
jgi:glycosyltransferase involved in cell wall biosynthesis